MKQLLVGAVLATLLACPAMPPPPPPSCDGGCPDTDAGTGGCGPGTFTTSTGQCQRVGWTTCDAGFTTDPTGWTCRAVVERCDAGQAAFPGEGCSALGWSVCPAGFTPTATSCEPVLPSAACTGATRAALGQTNCVPVGDCSAPFPPPAATVFVDADGGVDATHFRTIAAALSAAPAGATIAIADGRYAESLKPTRPVKLVGRCPSRVSLVGNPGIELIRTRDVELESLTVRDSILAARLELGASLRLRHVVLEDNLRSGIQALDRGTQVVLDDVVIRGTAPDPATATFGQGIAMGSAAQLTLTDVELRGNGETALFLNQAGTAATLTRVLVSDTQPRASTGRLGWGIAVQAGASLTATQLVVQDNLGVGILIAQRGSSATLTDTVVRRIAESTDATGAAFGFGVSAQAATLTWTGGAIEDVTGGLLDVQGTEGVATVRNVTGQRTLAGGAPRFGVEARNGAKVTLERVWLANLTSSGVLALDRSEVTIDHLAVAGVTGIGLRAQGGRITGTAVDVRNHTEAGALASLTGQLQLSRSVLANAASTTADGGLGLGASASQNSSLTLDECLLDNNLTAGVYVRDPGSRGTVTRSELRGTRLDANGEFGQGVIVESGAKVTMDDVAVSQNHTSGVQVAGAASELTMTRVTVLGTLPLGSGSRGRGANVAFGAAMRSTSSAFVDNQQVGLFAFQSRIEATDTLVRGTRADPDGRYGNGIEALTDGVISFVKGAIDRSESIGAVFAEGAGLIDGTRMTNNTIALHAQDGTTIVELPAPPVSLGNRQVVVTGSTSFEGNQSRTGSDVVTVPPP
ncbi:MAG: right-handed parallel beta-helix repeat-containing protein [Myxococcales bacterium]|nr:right-handed parallel beta-helix repeat-containing protein [Myxococcales bacterium]